MYGFIFLRVFSFSTTLRLGTDIENVLLGSLTIGFIIHNMMLLIPWSINPTIDVLGISATTCLISYVLAKIYKSSITQNFLTNVLHIHKTVDTYIWDSLNEDNYPTIIRITTKNGTIIEGFPDLVEDYTDDPHITIGNYSIFDSSGNVKKISKANEMLYFFLPEAAYYEFKFDKRSDKMKDLQELMGNDLNQYII